METQLKNKKKKVMGEDTIEKKKKVSVCVG